MRPILEVRRLSKYFRHQWTWRRIPVLHDVSFSVEAGEIFGLIGHNGAGKTTSFKLLLGLLRPNGGRVAFQGRPLDDAARVDIGFLPEQSYYYEHLTVEETLDLYARLYGMPARRRRERIEELLVELDLGSTRRASVRTLSKGTLQRVGVAQAIVNHPKLVILDEPMSGLDPVGRHRMRDLILRLRDAGTTVIFSSHILPDAERLCTRVGILAHGRLREVIQVAHDGPPVGYLLTISDVAPQFLAAVTGDPNVTVLSTNGTCQLRLNDQHTVKAVLDSVTRAGGRVESLTPIHPSLEERFLAYVEQAKED